LPDFIPVSGRSGYYAVNFRDLQYETQVF